MSTIRTVLGRTKSRALGIKRQHSNPYATHVPVLLSVSRIVRPKSVLELGSGPFSTSLFLNSDAFPDLERLVSFEDDSKWADIVSSEVGDDPRFDYRLVDRVPNAVPDDLSRYDLIFVDDSTVTPDRVETIRRVLGQNPQGLVVVHDFENRFYRAAARGKSRQYIMGTFTPQVGLLSQGDSHEEEFKRVSSVLDEGARRKIDLEDVDAWLELLRSRAVKR